MTTSVTLKERDPETEAPSVNPDDPDETQDPDGTPKENPSGRADANIGDDTDTDAPIWNRVLNERN